MGGWMKIYGIRFSQKQQEDLLRLIKPHEIRTLNQSRPILKAEKMLGKFKTCTFQLSMSKYVLVRDYLLSYLCLNNAQITSTIEWMLATDVGKDKKYKFHLIPWRSEILPDDVIMMSSFS